MGLLDREYAKRKNENVKKKTFENKKIYKTDTGGIPNFIWLIIAVAIMYFVAMDIIKRNEQEKQEISKPIVQERQIKKETSKPKIEIEMK